MSTFTNRTIKSTYDQLLHIEGDQIQNGLGANLLSASFNLSGSQAITGSFAVDGDAQFTGSVSMSGNLIIDGTASITYLVTTYESASIIFASGSTKFGDSLDDTHQFTGSVTITGSLNSPYISGSFSGSYQGDGSGLTGTITSSHAVTASHAISSSYAVSSSEATLATNIFINPDNTDTSTNFLLFSQGTSGSHRANTDDVLTYVPSTNTVTATKFVGALEGNATSADTASVVLGTITSASFAVTASYAESQSVVNITSGSFASSGDGPFTGSFSSSRYSFLSGSMTGSYTGSFTGSGEKIVGVISSSLSETASFALNAGGGGGSGAGFPFSGSADITGSLAVTGAFFATSITETSALRYKENVSNLDSIASLYKLRPVTFDWKDTGVKDIGLIAEEVKEHVPELVHLDEEGGAEGIKYSKLTSLLIKAVQDQQTEIIDLKSRLDNLDS
jgi:cytoskeletal protein CcmA (bactofilin family)